MEISSTVHVRAMVLSYFRSPASVQYFTCKGHVQRLQRYFRKYGSTKVRKYFVRKYFRTYTCTVHVHVLSEVQLRVRVRVRVQYIVVLTAKPANEDKASELGLNHPELF